MIATVEAPKLFPQSPELKNLKKIDAIVVGYFANDEGEITFFRPHSFIREIEKTFDLSLLDELDFFSAKGKAGEFFEIPVSAPGLKVDRIIFLGLGARSSSDIRFAGATLGRKFRGAAKSIFCFLLKTPQEIKSFGISIVLGSYTWNMKSSSKKLLPSNFYFDEEHATTIENANLIGQAVWRARDLIHTPSNIKTPAWIAQQAKKFVSNTPVTVKVLYGKELAPFGGLSAIGNSSPKPGPRFIELSYAPRGSKNWPHVVLVGKGITYDTGGVSLKRPYDLMIPMKSDMAGAAAILSVISALPKINPKVRVTALLMCAENALSRTSTRPGDVITQYGGTTVEIINTDAEGRLVLADGLAYADQHLRPDYLIDLATLTGAATLGLSRQYGAMYTRNSALARKFYEIGQKCGDRVWHMPLVDDYQDGLVSSVADLNHIASSRKYQAGSVTAALFLEHFAGNRQWVHFDIAGPARSESDSGENPKGGTGFGVRLLIEWIASMK
ncbi:MAG: leucyl aminopeptidase family protein [Actinomycetota bacterium]